jgi:hypothetical protein
MLFSGGWRSPATPSFASVFFVRAFSSDWILFVAYSQCDLRPSS